MDQFVYAAFMIYAILAVLITAFVVYILPSLVITVWESLVQMEWVERLLLAIEEVREWNREPGRHCAKEAGVRGGDEVYFRDLAKMWVEVEDTLRVDLKKKAPANV